MALAALIRRPPRAWAAVALAAVLSAAPASADLAPRPEHEVKAAFLYNFAKFIEWPPRAFQDSAQPFRIALLGQDPFGPELEKMLSGKTLYDRPLLVKKISTPEEARDCQILFIASSEQGRLEKILAALDGSPVLTVGEMDRFAERGGMIGFTMEDKRVRFNINQLSASAAGLRISSELLKLAKTVRDAPRPGGT